MSSEKVMEIVHNEKDLDVAITKGVQIYVIAENIILSSNKIFPKHVEIYGCKIKISNFQMFLSGSNVVLCELEK